MLVVTLLNWSGRRFKAQSENMMGSGAVALLTHQARDLRVCNSPQMQCR
jgi:hypothetical protein